MRVLKINNKDYVIKFTSQTIKELNAKGITLGGLIEDLDKMKVDKLYDIFEYGLKAMQHDITTEKALSIIDEYYDEDENNDFEEFFKMLLEEYSKAMGLGKKFKELMSQENQ